jgi:hypothetical protein
MGSVNVISDKLIPVLVSKSVDDFHVGDDCRKRTGSLVAILFDLIPNVFGNDRGFG